MLFHLDVAALEGGADLAFVAGLGAALVGERAGIAAFDEGELLLRREDVERAAGAGLQFLLFRLERLAGEVQGGARRGDPLAGRVDLTGGGGDLDGDVLLQADQIGLGLAHAQLGGPGATAALRKPERQRDDDPRGVRPHVLIAHLSPRGAKVAIHAGIAVAADKIDPGEQWVAGEVVARAPTGDAEARRLEIGAQVVGPTQVARGVEGEVGGGGEGLELDFGSVG